jgi:hypothetical protein
MSTPEIRALIALHRLWRVETDAARRDLGQALAQETALAARDAAIETDLREGLRVSGDFDRQAFSAWLARLRIERTELAGAMREAEARTTDARAALSRRRVAETVAEEALAEERAARDVARARRDQVMLEDVARALKRATTSARSGS